MVPLRLPWLTRTGPEHHWLRFTFQHLAAIQGGRIFHEVFLNASQDWMEVGIKPIDFVLAVPLPIHKSAIQQACQVVRDPALLNPELLSHFIHVMRLVSQ